MVRVGSFSECFLVLIYRCSSLVSLNMSGRAGGGGGRFGTNHARMCVEK